MGRRLQVVDVFSTVPFAGNPLAVVVDADGMSSEQMQQFTRWMDHSESAFLLPPTDPRADYRVRIFTLGRELAFAGHPTLGSCHAWLAAGGVPRRDDTVVQECGVGLVHVRRSEDRLAFAAPPLLRGGPPEADLRDRLPAILGIDDDTIVDCRWVDNGPGWLGVLLPDAATVLAVDPDFSAHRGEGSFDIGLVGPHPPGSDWAFEVRGVFSDPQGAMREDPVTGSLNASVGQWLFETGRATSSYVARQGTRLGRHGRVHVELADDEQVWVGGATTTRVEGRLGT